MYKRVLVVVDAKGARSSTGQFTEEGERPWWCRPPPTMDCDEGDEGTMRVLVPRKAQHEFEGELAHRSDKSAHFIEANDISARLHSALGPTISKRNEQGNRKQGRLEEHWINKMLLFRR